MNRRNCWEFFQCGRQPGGEKAGDLGICPAAAQVSLNGINEGVNGGRSCWAIAGTLCKGKAQGTYAQKLGDCLRCEFYASVRQDQGENFTPTKNILKKLNGNGTDFTR
jgi:hypothetical protein